ncbi:MAG: Hint domain-containing protein [Patescibacteria group bacterium]
MKKKYIKPKITAKKIVSQLASRRLFSDSFDGLLELDTSLLAQSCCGTSCMPGKTNVLLKGGKTKMISRIKKGDCVISWEIQKNAPTANTVAKVLIYEGKDGYVVINDSLTVTPNHHIWVNHAEWEEARRLRLGDMIVDSLGNEVVVSKLERREGAGKVYNLIMKNKNHNFFAENVLVHNAERLLASHNST